MTNGTFPQITWSLAWQILVVALGASTVYYNTLGSQSERISTNKTDIAVLQERTSSMTGNFVQMNDLVNLTRAEAGSIRKDVDVGQRQIIGWLLAGERPKLQSGDPADTNSSVAFLRVDQEGDIDKYRGEIQKLSPLPAHEVLEERRIVAELESYAAKEKRGDLTLEEAIQMGRLSDRLGTLKQEQIARSLRRGHTTIDCEVCRKLCGPLI